MPHSLNVARESKVDVQSEIRESKAYHSISVWPGYPRKTPVTEKFLNELFQGKTTQTPAMKYGLTNEIRAAKKYLDRGTVGTRVEAFWSPANKETVVS